MEGAGFCSLYQEIHYNEIHYNEIWVYLVMYVVLLNHTSHLQLIKNSEIYDKSAFPGISTKLKSQLFIAKRTSVK